ncbi:hypothetical protein MUCCIDRAFT_83227 [Mucor lusitanicus CBS 277.49]|uniref:Uncharacterized protein n=1 Tax=Mucor lusitanicus CBS 277.49 TaxID=747725 RepID=A0A168JQI3_MUCCL|nr:hypothetical protein MUCCIDRAFT_83227 [Mucor lusitanicus CBS 277.49]
MAISQNPSSYLFFYQKYYINKYAVIKKSNKIVKETHVSFMRYPRLTLKNARSGKFVDIQVDKLMANAFMRYEFTDTRNIIIDYINSDKNNNRLGNLQIVTMDDVKTLFAHGGPIRCDSRWIRDVDVLYGMFQWYFCYKVIVDHLFHYPKSVFELVEFGI